MKDKTENSVASHCYASSEPVSDLWLVNAADHIQAMTQSYGHCMHILMGLAGIGSALRRGEKLRRLQVLLRWANRQKEGHVNCAPEWYSQQQSTAWVNGWDAAMARLLELSEDFDELCKSVPEEDLELDA